MSVPLGDTLIGVKRDHLGDRIVTVQPEYDDVVAPARTGRSIADVLAQARAEAEPPRREQSHGGRSWPSRFSAPVVADDGLSSALAQPGRNQAARSASALAVGSDVSTANCRGGSLPMSTASMWRIAAVNEGSCAPELKVRSPDDPTTSW